MDKEQAKDRFSACLLGMSVGDALGKPVNGYSPYDVRRLFQSMDGFFQCPRTKTAPGTFSAPTQLCVITSKSILGDRLDKTAMAKGMAEWMPKARGWSASTLSSTKRFSDGSPFEQCGAEVRDPDFLSRAIPVGLSHSMRNSLSVNEEELYEDCEAAASLTNKGTSAALSAYVIARITREFVRRDDKLTNPATLFQSDKSLLARIIEFCRVKEGTSDDAMTDPLFRRLTFVAKCLKADNSLEYLNGVNHGDGSHSEVVAFAAFCVLKKPDSHLAVRDAAGMGGPAALRAALVGGMCGAYNGVSTIPSGLKDQVEQSPKLIMLSEKLFEAVSPKEKEDGKDLVP